MRQRLLCARPLRSFTWHVYHDNPAVPFYTPDDQNNAEGDEVLVYAPASGTGGNAIVSYDISGQPAGVSIDNDGFISGTIGYSAAETQGGVYHVIVSATDNSSSGAHGYTSFNWTITDFDPPPIVTAPPTQTTPAGGTVSEFAVSIAPGPDGEALWWCALNGYLPSGLSITNSGVIHGTLASNAGGVYYPTATAYDTGSGKKKGGMHLLLG